ncbi:MAG: baseplate J/gp47 family protein [Pyrinomonadaceae bacterium]
MATINLRENRQVIDYLARDYDSFRKALVDLIPAKLPEWTDRSEADFGMALLELFAYMADILSYYQDRIANEAFLHTAQERRSIINHLRLTGYEMAPPAAASTTLNLIVGNSVTQQIEVRKGDQFATKSGKDRKSVTFEYTADKPLVIDPTVAPSIPAKNPDGTLLPNFKEFENLVPVREGKTISNEVVGVSDGRPNQRYTLAQPNMLRGSLEIIVETATPTPAWRLRENLIFSRRAFTPEQLRALELQERIGSTLAFSGNTDTDYAVETDENNITTVIFGDGQYGRIPPTGTRIIAGYRCGGGTVGNVGKEQIAQVIKAPQLQLLGIKVINRTPASGGADRESIDQAIKYAPSVFASMQRAVTAEDYVAQAKLFQGVSKARAEATSWNVIKLYIAPTGQGEPPTDVMRRDLLAYFEDKRMLTSIIRIESPDYVKIDIEANVIALRHFRNDEVQDDAEKAVSELLDFEKVDFKQTLYLSKVYEKLEALPGVSSVFVTHFQRAGTGPAIAPDGLIQLLENQIPLMGRLVISVSGGV